MAADVVRAVTDSGDPSIMVLSTSTACAVSSGWARSSWLMSSSPAMSHRCSAASLRPCIVNSDAPSRRPENATVDPCPCPLEARPSMATPSRIASVTRRSRSSSSAMATNGASRRAKSVVGRGARPHIAPSVRSAISAAPAARCATMSWAVQPAQAVGASGAVHSSVDRNAVASSIETSMDSW